MKYKIWHEEEPVEEKPLMLRLLREKDGSIKLAVVDSSGDRRRGGYLISFCPDGSVHRPHSVNTDFGFELDDNGRLKID